MKLKFQKPKLVERFVQGDTSRNTSGSGLGLSIAKSFTELQHGTFNINVDGDLFKTTVIFNLK
ncbi:ATP-binding protein [Coprobacillaceae bacterium CR2/5/TPMF4]|nr:ATP-binding protein [Coprobacillaceae bacterium CR2/5/TPMF4]